MWIRKDEPACYKTNKSQIGSTKSNGLGRSTGPHRLHWWRLVLTHMGNLSKESYFCILVTCKKFEISYASLFVAWVSLVAHMYIYVFNSISVNLACLQSMSYLCSNMHFGLGDYHRKYDWMTFNYLRDMMILNNMLMSYEKHEIHIHAQMKKHELMIAFLNAKTCVKMLMRLKWKRIVYQFKDFTI